MPLRVRLATATYLKLEDESSSKDPDLQRLVVLYNAMDRLLLTYSGERRDLESQLSVNDLVCEAAEADEEEDEENEHEHSFQRERYHHFQDEEADPPTALLVEEINSPSDQSESYLHDAELPPCIIIRSTGVYGDGYNSVDDPFICKSGAFEEAGIILWSYESEDRSA